MVAHLIRSPLTAWIAAAILAFAGIWAWRQVPLDALPDLSDNQVVVWTEWPGKSPEDVDSQVTLRLSRELQGLESVRGVRGLSLQGSSFVSVVFDDSADRFRARTRVQERLAQAATLLPEGVQPRLGPDATAMGQVYGLVLRGDGTPEQRRQALERVVLPVLRGVRGVAEVAPVGGIVREYQIDVEPRRLEAAGVSLEDVMAAVRESGRDAGAMGIERNGIETMVRGVGFLRSVEDVGSLVLRAGDNHGTGLRIRDVARVQIGGKVRQGLLADETGEQVGAIVAMRAGEDPYRVIQATKEALGSLKSALDAADLEVDSFYDRSRLIEETSATLTGTVIEAIVAAALVVVFFLLHVRASLCVSICLPLGILVAFLGMHLMGVGANIMTLAGIGIAVGVMVDFSIIVTENTVQHLLGLAERRRAAGLAEPTSPFDPEVVDAVVLASREVTRPLLTSAATTIVGFLPILLLEDQAGRLFGPLAISKTLAIAGAVVIGLFLVPVLCRFLLPAWRLRQSVAAALSGGLGGGLMGWYISDGLRLPMDHGRWAIQVPGWLVAPVLAFLGSLLIWRLCRERLVPLEDNPTSRLIHVAYEWAYERIQNHRGVFLCGLALLAASGYLLGFGWERLAAPIEPLLRALGVDPQTLRAHRYLAERFPGVESSFLPPLDEGSLLFMPSVPAAAGLQETERVMMIQNRAIAAQPEVSQVLGKLGRAESALDPAPIGMIETVVELKPRAEWPAVDHYLPDGSVERRPRTLDEVRSSLAASTDIPGVAPSWLQPIETRVIMLSTGIRSLMALQVSGDEPQRLVEFAEQVEPLLRRINGAADVQIQRDTGKPYAEFRLDDAKLARFGLNRGEVIGMIESSIGGMALAETVEGQLRYPVRVRIARELRDDPEELDLIPLPLKDGGSVPLRSVLAVPRVFVFDSGSGGIDSGIKVDSWPLNLRLGSTVLPNGQVEVVLDAGQDPREIPELASLRLLGEREADAGVTWVLGSMALRSDGGRRTQYVLFNTQGRGEMEVIDDAERMLREALASGAVVLPEGVTYRWVGRFEEKIKADRTLRWVIGISFCIMAFLIHLGTRSVLITTVILFGNAVVGVAGGLFMVWLFDAQMTTSVAVGFLVLLGVLFNDGILLGTYLREQFLSVPTTVAEVRSRVFIAGLRRRRPAVMTNATTLIALVPVLWSEGRGSELMLPMALPVIGGMLFDVLSLFTVPVVFSWYWERRVSLALTAADQAKG